MTTTTTGHTCVSGVSLARSQQHALGIVALSAEELDSMWLGRRLTLTYVMEVWHMRCSASGAVSSSALIELRSPAAAM